MATEEDRNRVKKIVGKTISEARLITGGLYDDDSISLEFTDGSSIFLDSRSMGDFGRIVVF